MRLARSREDLFGPLVAALRPPAGLRALRRRPDRRPRRGLGGAAGGTPPARPPARPRTGLVPARDDGRLRLLHRPLRTARFRGVLDRLDYLDELGVTYVHFMPCLKPRPGDSDGGYSVMDYRAIDPRYGTHGRPRSGGARAPRPRHEPLRRPRPQPHRQGARLGGEGAGRRPGVSGPTTGCSTIARCPTATRRR